MLNSKWFIVLKTNEMNLISTEKYKILELKDGGLLKINKEDILDIKEFSFAHETWIYLTDTGYSKIRNNQGIKTNEIKGFKDDGWN